MNLAVTTPIERDKCIVRFNFRFKTMGDEQTTQGVGKAFVNEVHKQVLEDKPIWEHKAHLVRPALADTDGPFMKFRKWCAQFYAEPVGAATSARCSRRRTGRTGSTRRRARRPRRPGWTTS